MNPSDDKQLFLDMQEHPEKYSDEQLEAMMAEIDREPDTNVAWSRFDNKTEERPTRLWWQIAAALGGVIFMVGIAFAAIHMLTRNAPKEPHQSSETTISIFEEEKSIDPVVFENVPLDSILTRVSSHYKKVVVFQDEAPRQMKLIMTWHPDAPLTDFIDRLNAFDGLSLHIQNDTIIVEQIIEEEE